jgi:hypothetical protein
MSASVPGWRPDGPDGWLVAPVETLPGKRPIVGYVYELITGDPQDGAHPYVGQTERTVHQRVHGSGGHTSPESIAKDPWKARILPGRAGYRILERVRDTGEGDRANELALNRAEAFWIDRLRSTHNDIRPVRPPVHESGPVPARRTRQPSRAELAALARRRRATRRLAGFAVLAAAGTFVAVRLILALNLPWPAAPWVAGPALGVFAGWVCFVSIDGWVAVLTGRRPAQRHRSRRRRHW